MASDRGITPSASTIQHFLSVFFPVLGSFVTSRLLVQTDIIMIAPLGPDAVAAYAVPQRVMIIDAIVAFALMPIVGIRVSRAQSNEDKRRAVQSALGLTSFIGVALAAIGWVLYPMLAALIVRDTQVLPLAHEAVHWMTASIPVRMLTAVATSCVFALGTTKCLKYLYMATVTLNAALNWLLIYRIGFGLAGSYASTTIVSALECLVVLGVVSRYTQSMPIGRFKMDWLRSVAKELGAEWFRLLNWQAEGFALLSLFSINASWTPQMAVFSVTTSIAALLTMPLIAAMRATAISATQRSSTLDPCTAQAATREIGYLLVLVCGLIGAAFAIFGFTGGERLYRFSEQQGSWWQAFVVCASFLLPISGLCAVKRGVLQTEGKYGLIARCDLFATWLWCLPGSALSLHLGSPWMFFAFVMGKDPVAYCALLYGSRRRAKPPSASAPC